MKTNKSNHRYSPLTERRNKKYRRIKKKYTTYSIGTLRFCNRAYDSEHGVCSADVTKVNKLIWLLEKDRPHNYPVPGDIVRYTSQYGEYLPKAHIKNTDNGICTIREQAGVYVDRSTKKGIFLMDSGGCVVEIPLSGLKYKGKELKSFWTFGSCGACGGGGLYFRAKVNVWEYIHPEPYFEDYTTKDWHKSYVYEDKPEFGTVRYYTERLTFKSRENFEQYVRIVKGKLFNGHSPAQEVLFGYSETFCCISQQEWDKHDLPAINIEWNGEKAAKYHVDDTARTITFYYFYSS